jgi:hypothetical protein
MDLSQLIVLDPNNAQAYVDRATIKHIGRDFDRAIADYGEAVRLDAKLAYPPFYIWLIRFQQQRMAQANLFCWRLLRVFSGPRARSLFRTVCSLDFPAPQELKSFSHRLSGEVGSALDIRKFFEPYRL